jgi:hypothetical protein
VKAEEIQHLYEGLSFEDRMEVDRQLAVDMQNVIWRPLIDPENPDQPTPQMQAYLSEADIMLFGGQAGGGKTGLLAGLSLTEHQRTVIYRREIKQAAAIAEEIIRFRRTRDGYNGQDKIFRMEGNRIIQLAGMQYDSDKQKFKGVPFDLIAFDEVTDFLESQFRFVITWNRAVNPDQRCRVIATCNPPTTAEGRWVVEYWAPWLDPYHPNPALPGELRWFTTDAKGHDTERENGDPFEDETGEIVVPRSRTFIPSSVDDNPFLAHTGYKANLQSLPEPLRSQMLKGDFTAGGEDNAWQVIPTAWVEAAQARWTERKPKGVKMTSLGVDPARGGRDQTVLSPRYDWWFDKQIVRDGVDTPESSDVTALIYKHAKDNCAIQLDIIGGAGASVYDNLKTNNMNVHSIDGRHTSHARDRTGKLGFANFRAEMWWRMREALDPENGEQIALPPSRPLLSDLCSPRWKLSTKGIQVEGKGANQEDEAWSVKKRLGRSPDLGDAAVYALINARGHNNQRKLQSRANNQYNPQKWR